MLTMNTRRTRSQEIVYNLLKTIPIAISAQHLHMELRRNGQNTGLATVYRALEALKLEGLVQVRTLPTGESLYGCIQQDVHHLTCLNCSKSIPIAECPVENLKVHLEQEHTFKVYYHTLEFFGVCQECQIAG